MTLYVIHNSKWKYFSFQGEEHFKSLLSSDDTDTLQITKTAIHKETGLHAKKSYQPDDFSHLQFWWFGFFSSPLLKSLPPAAKEDEQWDPGGWQFNKTLAHSRNCQRCNSSVSAACLPEKEQHSVKSTCLDQLFSWIMKQTGWWQFEIILLRFGYNDK